MIRADDVVDMTALGFIVHSVTVSNSETGEVWYASPTSIPDVTVAIDLGAARRTKRPRLGKNRARYIRKRSWLTART